ncbi:MAG: amidohydrolase, partial [Gammaproteobacteria bacterium]|nr:amidohydrolase [Gammaproteobacteria bacterium]
MPRSRHAFAAAFAVPALLLSAALAAQDAPAAQRAEVTAVAQALQDKVVAWRRDIHQHPELGNREFRTAELVADHLRSLGLEPQTGIAHTGVTAVLKGGRPGLRIALRADMDALPVTEQTGLPFASTATTEFNGQQTGVMHACGHDAHTAILMGVAEALAGMREELAGEVLFVFQPAEEGAPEGEEGGAKLMLEEGIFERFQPDAVFGLHVFSTLNADQLAVRAGPTMAASDTFDMRVIGRQTHGSRPWGGVDPVIAAAQIVT